MATTAINMDGDGNIVNQSGVMAPLTIVKVDTGHYEIEGCLGLAKQGWQTSIYQDENGENTIRVEFEEINGKLIIKTFDPKTNEQKDIVHLLTLRLEVDDIEITQ